MNGSGKNDLMFTKFIEFHKKKLQREIINIQADLADFEKRYDMKSSSFYSLFEKGKVEDSEDYMIWAGIYEMFLSSKKKLNELS